MDSDMQRVVVQLVGLRCVSVDYPFEGTLELAFSPAPERSDTSAALTEVPRQLIVRSPWRVQTDAHVLIEWQLGLDVPVRLPRLIEALVGRTIAHVTTELPAWDLRVCFDNGTQFCVFGDRDYDEDEPWSLQWPSGLQTAPRIIGPPLPEPDDWNA